MSNNEEIFELYIESYQYFSEKTNNPEIGARLARDYMIAMIAGMTIGNKNILDRENLKWFFGEIEE